MFKSMYDAAGNTKEVVRALAHGLSRGIISMAQGGTFKSGFASGFSASFFSPGTTVGGDGAGGFGLRTSIAAIAGGTASALGGGKFANGAISGAFVHMFNAEGGTLQKIGNQAKELWDKFTDYISAGVTVGGGIHTGLVGVNGQYNPLSDSLTVCVRVGPGLFAGAGVSATGSIDSNPNSNGSQYSAGVGGDYMNGIYGNGGSVSVSSDTVSGSYATRAGIGVGLSLGVDLCGTF